MSAFPENRRAELLAAMRFLTRLPFGDTPFGDAGDNMPRLADAAWALPVAGIVIGVVGGAAYLVAQALGLPNLAAAVVAVGATVLVTGALHEDGLADTADGFGGGITRAEKLEIMRDSRIGTYGVLALIFSLAARAAALSAIGGGWRVLVALVAAHGLARGFLPAAMRVLDPAREDGLGAAAGKPSVQAATIAFAIGAAAALVATGLRPGVAAIVAGAIVAAIVGLLARRQIGGQTGDVLGAIEQGGEIAALLAIAAAPG